MGNEWGLLELDGGVKDEREDDNLSGVRVGKSDECGGACHLRRGRVDSPTDPAGGRDEGAGEGDVESGVVGVECPCNGSLLGGERHAFCEGFGGCRGGAVGGGGGREVVEEVEE